MFRLANFEEGTELYKYLSSISSKTIYDALCEWVSTPYELLEFYEEEFETGYFDDIGKFLKTSPSGAALAAKYAMWCSEWFPTEELPEEAAAGIEFLWRKRERMMEKMLDQEKYYTFDLFEELLFDRMIGFMAGVEEMQDSPEGREMFSEQISKRERAIKKTRNNLIKKFGFDTEEAAWIAHTVNCAGSMSLSDAEYADFESLFFWDDDYIVFFDESDTFVEAIHQIVSGIGAMTGYGYEDIVEIFTDAGYQIPIFLVGTKTAYETREEDAQEWTRKIREDIFSDLTHPDSPDGDEGDMPDISDWPDEEHPYN